MLRCTLGLTAPATPTRVRSTAHKLLALHNIFNISAPQYLYSQRTPSRSHRGSPQGPIVHRRFQREKPNCNYRRTYSKAVPPCTTGSVATRRAHVFMKIYRGLFNQKSMLYSTLGCFALTSNVFHDSPAVHRGFCCHEENPPCLPAGPLTSTALQQYRYLSSDTNANTITINRQRANIALQQ